MHVKYSATGERLDMVSVKAGCLEALSKELLSNAVHIWTQHAVVDIPKGVRAFAQGPV